MIVPTKHLKPQRALLSLGAKILQKLARPKTMSALCRELPVKGSSKLRLDVVNYEEMVLALDLLYMIGAIEFTGKYIKKV